MSLDVCIHFGRKKPVDYNGTHVACGSTMALRGYGEAVEDSWSANVTHNMGPMARNVPVRTTTLYMAVWRPDELFKRPTTDDILPMLNDGIAYMASHKEALEKFNPENGWGSYKSFLPWLRTYREMCEDNPGCLITVSR